MLSCLRGRVSKLDVEARDCGVITGEQFGDMVAEVGVVCDGVDDGRSQRTAQGEIVLDKEVPPRSHNLSDRLWEILRLAQRPLELDEDVGESEIERFAYELCLPAGEKTPERASRAAGVSDDLAEPDPVDPALTDQHRGAFHHARAGR